MVQNMPPNALHLRVRPVVRITRSRFLHLPAWRTFFDEFDHHGGCAEAKCLIKAYNAEGPNAICGGHMDVVHVGDDPDGNWEHGDVVRPCGRCDRLKKGLFIGT